LIEHVAHTQRDSPGAAHDAASVHFGPSITYFLVKEPYLGTEAHGFTPLIVINTSAIGWPG